MRIPSTSLAQSQAMQLDLETGGLEVSARWRSCSLETGTAEIAADPMPPNASDTYIILKPQEEWPDPSLTKAELIERIGDRTARSCRATVSSFSQPIQMRFNELIAGVREDVAVKVFGDEFEPMLQIRQRGRRRAAGHPRRRGRQGRAGRRACRSSKSSIDKTENRAPRPELAAVQDVIGTAIGGREAGLVFEGDRRFQIVVRLPDALRADVDAICRPCRCRCRDEGGAPSRMTIPLARRGDVRRSPRGPTRSAARTASAASS